MNNKVSSRVLNEENPKNIMLSLFSFHKYRYSYDTLTMFSLTMLPKYHKSTIINETKTTSPITIMHSCVKNQNPQDVVKPYDHEYIMKET